MTFISKNNFQSSNIDLIPDNTNEDVALHFFQHSTMKSLRKQIKEAAASYKGDLNVKLAKNSTGLKYLMLAELIRVEIC